MASSAAMASELHPIEDVSLIDSGEETISIRAHLLMEDSCAYPTVSTATVDNFSGVINLKQTARDPEVFCNQVITERETNFEINTNELTSGEYEIIDEFGKESLGTLYIGPRGSIDLLKFKEHLL
jgi:hypothetical protein